jgi:hypothetical protein
MLTVFYNAFSPACFALLGLWLVIVGLRLPDWKKSDEAQQNHVHQRRSYGVALYFALPGVMSVLALVNPDDSTYWRVSFIIIAFGAAPVMYLLHDRIEKIPRWLDEAVRGATIVAYILIGVLAILRSLRPEAILLTFLVFLGFNVAWLLLWAGLPENFKD